MRINLGVFNDNLRTAKNILWEKLSTVWHSEHISDVNEECFSKAVRTHLGEALSVIDSDSCMIPSSSSWWSYILKTCSRNLDTFMKSYHIFKGIVLKLVFYNYLLEKKEIKDTAFVNENIWSVSKPPEVPLQCTRS